MNKGQSIWHCKFLGEDEDGIQTYLAPQEYKLAFNYITINPVSGYLAVLQYGKQISKIWSMKAKKSIFDGVFHEGDLLYVDGNFPNIEDENYENGYNANARVQSVHPLLQSISIELEKIQPC